MRSENHNERILEVAGAPFRLISFRVGESWLCRVDNTVSGVVIAWSIGPTRGDAEKIALDKAVDATAPRVSNRALWYEAETSGHTCR